MHATAEVVAARGCAQTSVDLILARAGLSPATFYESFRDSEDAILAAFEWGAARLRAAVIDGYSAASDRRSGLRAAVAAALCMLDGEPAMARLLLVEAFGGGPRLLERRAALVAQLTESLQRLGDSGPLAVMAQGAVGGVLSVLHTRTIDELREPLADLLDDLTELLLVFCAAPPPREARADCGSRPRPKRRLSIAPAPLSTVRLADWRP